MFCLLFDSAYCATVERGGPWAQHCVAETQGAEFAPGLALPPQVRLISKATQRDRDAYSGSSFLNVGGLFSFWALCDFEFDFLAFF